MSNNFQSNTIYTQAPSNQNKRENDTHNPKPLEEPSYTPPTKKEPEQN